DGQRQAARHPVEDAFPGGCDERPEARRQRAADQGHEPVGQPADRRSAAGRREEVPPVATLSSAGPPLLQRSLSGLSLDSVKGHNSWEQATLSLNRSWT